MKSFKINIEKIKTKKKAKATSLGWDPTRCLVAENPLAQNLGLGHAFNTCPYGKNSQQCACLPYFRQKKNSEIPADQVVQIK